MKGLIDLVVPTGMAVAVAVFKTEPAEQATSVTFPQARHVATFAADGWGLPPHGAPAAVDRRPP